MAIKTGRYFALALSQYTEDGGETLRKTNYDVASEEELSSEKDDEVQSDPSERTKQPKQREREDSLDEEDILLAELQKRIRVKNIIDEQQYKDEHDQTVELGSNENRKSEQNEYCDQNYEISLDSQTVPLDEDMKVYIKIGQIIFLTKIETMRF